MVRVIIVDDERNVLELIDSQLSEMVEFEVIGAFTNPLKAYEAIISKKPALVITDIEMPELSGIKLAKKVLEKGYDIQFVFLTAYRQYAIDAFNINASHYLLKPVSKKDLKEVYYRIVNTYTNNKNDESDIGKIKIITLGDFSVINTEGKRVEFPTLKVEELFALLIMNMDTGVGKWKIINELWDISEIKNPLQNLYTTIYRLRETFKKYNLPYDINKTNDHYSINIKNTFFDYEEYNKLMNQLKILEVTKENIEAFKKLIYLYSGDLFMYNDYIWCLYDRSSMNYSYNLILGKIRKFYKKNCINEGLSEIDQLIIRNNNNI